MKTSPILRLCLGLSAVALIAGCAGSSPKKESESGYLPDYSQLRERKCESTGKEGGGQCFVWVSPRLTPENYNALLLERLDFFPEPKPNADVSQETLDRIHNYMDSTLREKLGQHIRLVDTPGPGVARMRWALTAVGSESESLAVYQYIPVALVITGAKAAAEGGLPRDARVAFEIEITDSVTKEPLWLAMRGGTGERLKSYREGERKVNLEEFKKLFDTWTDNAGNAMAKYIKAK